jgi:hypothetical protein
MASRKQELLGRYLDSLRGEDDSLNLQDRHKAREILDKAANEKVISRADLKQAIRLYAGEQSTPNERAAVGSKMLAFIAKKQVKLT